MGGGKIVKNNLLIGTAFLSLALGAASCTNDSEQLTDSRTAPMSVQVANHIASRGLITTGTLPADDYGIGVTLVNKSDKAPYDGQTGYANNQWKTANGTTWDIVEAANPNLTGTEGVAVAYYPYSSTVTSYEAIPVESASQTDYMYSGWSNDLTNASPEATFTMQHALAAVRVKLVASANYTGDKSAFTVTISSDGFMATASLDASTGILSSKDGAGAEHTLDNLGLTLDATGQDVDFLVIPADAPADINFITTIGGKQYAATVTPGEALAQGLIHTYTLTLTAAGMKVSTVEVTPWGEGQTGSDDLVPYDPLAKYADWVQLTYNVTDISTTYNLLYNTNQSPQRKVDINIVDKIAVMEVDSRAMGKPVILDEPTNSYKFSTTGECKVFVKFKDVTTIPENAFNGINSIVSVTIPKTVTYINTRAFMRCDNLKEIIALSETAPEFGSTGYNLYNIGEEGRLYVPEDADYSAWLSAINHYSNGWVIIENNYIISNGIYYSKDKKKLFTAEDDITGTVVIPNGVTSISENAFYKKTGLTGIELPETLTEIGESAFEACTGLTGSLIIPNSVTSIAEKAFHTCSGLTEVTIGSGVETIDGAAFFNCSSLDRIISLARTAPTLKEWNTFRNMKSNGTLVIPQGSDYSAWMQNSDGYLGYINWKTEYK